MGSRGKLPFDLNEPPAVEVEDEKTSNASLIQPQKTLPTSNLDPSILFNSTTETFQVANKFTHATSGSGFQPFVRPKNMQKQEALDDLILSETSSKKASIPENNNNTSKDVESVDREEGELDDIDDNDYRKKIAEKENETERSQLGLDTAMLDNSSNNIGTSKDIENDDKEDKSDGPEELPISSKAKDIKGIEAIHAARIANNLGKKHKVDEHKEAMLGKKRARQTQFINADDVKHSSMKSSTSRRTSSFPSIITRTVKETSRSNSSTVDRTSERQTQPLSKTQKQPNAPDSNGDAGSRSRFKRLNVNESPSLEDLRKQPVEFRQPNTLNSTRKPSAPGPSTLDAKSGSKKLLPPKKQSSNNLFYQDTSVERLHREVTNEKFWHHPEEADLQCVPGQFESVEEYVQVFEPLLFEECRAQLFSTWEEVIESSRDAHTMVRVRSVERRERGWFDVIVFPCYECKWTFKEGEVAILSSPRPSAARYNKRIIGTGPNKEESGSDITGRVAGIVRRHTPVDSRDPIGAVLHFYIGEMYDSSKVEDNHILRKLQPKSVWYLTVLGSLATTQREYVALHAFRRLSNQMQSAILKPSPELFPKYEEQPPAMPECFTPSFIDHLHQTFNGPQLAAIQWAAMHTAAGTTSNNNNNSSSGSSRKQEPWPFTLVQGPPGTGKTHTVWGMLNVIHLVQYQHYYAALLKQLAPESYKQSCELEGNTNNNMAGGSSIDELLQNMDQNLFRTLPKLSPKPRMLVCAPSNAATDELLARVLDRGFIDGEMQVYRPDVARVGVDSQTRAAQAVSVERRTEQLLLKGREEVFGWMHQLRNHEANYSQQISHLQRQLSAAALAGRSQGSVGVDPDVLVARDQNRDVLLRKLAQAVEGRDKVLVEMTRLCILESRFRPGSNFNLEDARAHLEASFANEAEIVFTTVSSSGRKIFSRLNHGFDMVVIDEAAQASEVAVLPPLSLGAARCVLVGDPQQLPATVISKAAGTLLYSRSLFERFQQAGCPTMLLSVQYRMHPQIRDFPSRYFYQSRLTDSESVATLQNEIYYKDPILQPYMFFDIMHGRESHRGGSASYQNVQEANFALRIYEYVQNFLKLNGGGKKVTVGIITPYKLQLKCIQREFEQVLNSEEGKGLYINTVDAFQGQERDIIIMSCVRASNHGVGFVSDIRRMNVALTRARRALWVVGNANALMQSEDWAALINDAKSRSCFKDMESIPKELLSMKTAAATHDNSEKANDFRSMRTAAGQRQRQLLDIHHQPGLGPTTQTEAAEDNRANSNSKSIRRNDGYRDFR